MGYIVESFPTPLEGMTTTPSVAVLKLVQMDTVSVVVLPPSLHMEVTVDQLGPVGNLPLMISDHVDHCGAHVLTIDFAAS